MSGPSVELSMIAKDGAASLKRCLESVAPLVDRTLFGNTGSTDATVAIARSFCAEISPSPGKTTSPSPATRSFICFSVG